MVHHRRHLSPLDPQMLFAGQWLDNESGLAYNRFRYYDPETANYLTLDPIGLQGGETPYRYVGNPLDWVDLWGLAGCPSLEKGEYRKVGGHHIHAKAGFKDHVHYDPKKGFAISQEYMKLNGWNHQKMTNKQRELFKELEISGRANTMKEHSRIAVKALEAGGVSTNEARKLVSESLLNLRKQGVRTPTNIPWRKTK